MIDKRLMAIANLIRKNKVVCDVGTDHAYLPCYLVKEGLVTSAIAADVNEKPLQFARNHIKKNNLEDSIKIVLSDGLCEIDPSEADDIVIAGMGGELIFKLLTDVKWTQNIDKRFILQPMTRVGYLRKMLYQSGFEIISETPVNYARQYYTIMLVKYVGVDKNITDLFYHVGKVIDLDTDEARVYLNHELKKLKKVADGKKRSNPHDPEIQGMLEVIRTLEERLL